MGYKAFDADVEPGGLRDKNEVKILICYLLKHVDKPLTFDNLNEITRSEGLVNYFELGDAVRGLLESGHIDLREKDGTEYYICTRLGAGTADLFERRLPKSVRDKAVKAAVRLLAKIKRESENTVEIQKRENGGYTIICKILDRNDELMEIRLFLPEQDQAAMVKAQFLKNPEMVYKGVLALMTGDKDSVGGLLDCMEETDKET